MRKTVIWAVAGTVLTGCAAQQRPPENSLISQAMSGEYRARQMRQQADFLDAVAADKTREQETHPAPVRNQARFDGRKTGRFDSFEDARQALAPLEDPATILTGFKADLGSIKGRPFATWAGVVQVSDDGRLLLNPCHSMGEVCVSVANVSPFYKGPRDAVEGHLVMVVAEVIGREQYTNALGIVKTVPRLTVYGMSYGGPQ